MPMRQGVTSTGDIASYRQKIDMSEKIAQLRPNAAPLTVLLKRMKNKRTVYNPEYDWMEDDLYARWDAINAAAGYAVGITALVVDNALYFIEGDTVKVPRTGEVMLVTAINTTTNTLTVKRGYGTTAAAALVDNDPLVIIGNANEEGAGLRGIRAQDPNKVTNYTQIFRTPVGLTRTQDKTRNHGPKEKAYQRMKAGIMHKVDMERAFLFGEKGKDTGTQGKPRRTTAGILSYMTYNVLDCSAATPTAGAINTWLEEVFLYGSSEKVLLASAKLCTIFDNIAENKLQTVPGAKTYGVAIKEYLSTHGKLYIVKHPLLEGAVYGKYGIAVDMENIAYCPLDASDTQLLTNRQNNDEDQEKDEYLTEAGIELRLPKTHAIIKNFV
ncbi:MAG TPA: DUF5309 family protein [Negativicutes bacterium]|nr:DUF5309 family protein [Negativicutes bacterium]